MKFSNKMKLVSNLILLALLVVGVQSQLGPPVFTTPLTDLENVMEGTTAHLECRLNPVDDPNLRIEWFFNEAPLELGSRFRATSGNEFGVVALDILNTNADDSGTYTCKATNALGEAVTAATITIQPSNNP